jgi:membrane-bound lytic murein transglycosylase A
MRKRPREIYSLIWVLLTSIAIFIPLSCDRWYRIEVTDPSKALVLLEGREIPKLEDDLDRESLARAIRQSLIYLERLPAERHFQYGPHRVSVDDVKQTLLTFSLLLQESYGGDEFRRRIREDFLWFRAAGLDIFGSVLFTGYYEPILEGRLSPNGVFRYPLYLRPSDILEINLGAFRETLKGQRLMGRLQGERVVPYYSRAEIDGEGALAEKGLEIAWLKDPVKLFFLHIQGSGQIVLEDGRRIHVNYAGTNGHPYRSIGKLLIDDEAIPKEKMSMQAIRTYLWDHQERLEEVLFSNPSYIFFSLSDKGPLGNLSVPLTPGRSIATDSRLFPGAGLAWIQTERPLVDQSGHVIEWREFSRFVLNQDTGGAIRGAGRVDLFCGSGYEAEMMAGHLKHDGRLLFLLKKPGT